MAGIGQHNSFDHPASWNSAAQLGMGRTVHGDSQNNLAALQANIDKRSLLSNSSGTQLSGLSSSLGLTYTPRPSSSTRSKGFLSSGGNFRNNYNPDSNLDSLPLGFLSHGNVSTHTCAPQRGLSEPSLLSGLGSFNQNVNPDMSTLMSSFANNSKASVIGMGSGSNKNLSGLINQGVASSGLAFDPSDFPPIINSVNQSQNQAFSGNSINRNYVSAISKGGAGGVSSSFGASVPSQSHFNGATTQSPPEFSIDQDFPALPVAQALSRSNAGLSLTPLSSLAAPIYNQTSLSLTGSSDKALKSQATNRNQLSHSRDPSRPETIHGGSLMLMRDHCVRNIPKNMICDQFGMLGLLKLIQIDPMFETLAPGLNLASMGIVHWPPPGELHTSFASPIADSCMLRLQDMDFPVPPEYQIRYKIANHLPHDPQLDQLSDEILFWLFYNCCREEIQLVAAKELYNREWRFHKKKQQWITRIPGSDVIRDSTSEQGAYYFWDLLTAEKLTQQMSICYADLDDFPTTYRLTSSTLNANVQPVATPQQLYHQQHHFNSGSSSATVGGSGSSNFPSAMAGRIPRPTTMPLSVANKMNASSMLPNGPIASHFSMTVNQDMKGSDCVRNTAPTAPSTSS